MTMTLDHNQHRFGALHFDTMSSYSGHPHFTNPWGSSSSAGGPGPAPQSGSQQSLYINNQDNAGLPHLNLAALSKHPQHSSRTGSSASMAPYGTLPVTAASAGSPPMAGVYRQQDLLPMPQDLLGVNRLQHPTTSAAYDASAYTSAASPVNPTYATSPSPYDQLSYAQAPMRGTFALGHEDSSRRYSQQSLQPDDRRSFQDALEASHGMLSMSQETPRNIYDVRSRQRGSNDSYGFPSTHSATSSVSSTGFSAYYNGGSVDGSVSDYSTTGSDIESMSGRTLPRPQGLMATAPPAPQSMMSSFSSKVSSSTQKKHKCKVCDKRFTRPSSLQTHMYSHTGEKPFSCEVEGCGRHFSVVSNLRRHKKVHKNQAQAETPSETGSEEHQSP
ncbi:hypothetical protein MFIFM68171_01631 [Madurella fahalii]|uniref:C2H2-type domain-containing protein n=1 Tax=Madurella fahalii TaxID=1157608 RepID=A0ABQ0G0Z5_9PEZI